MPEDNAINLVEDSIADDEPKYEVVDGKTILKLQYPIVFGTTTIEQLEFAKLKGKHLRGLPPLKENEITFDFLLSLVHKLTAQPPSVVDELQGEDLMGAIEVAGDFFDSSPLTTPNSSGT